MQAYLGHALGSALLGILLPTGEYLTSLHEVVQPLVNLIPNAVRITERAPDPVFAQTFVGLSLVIAFAILLYFIVAVHDYHTRTFLNSKRRLLALAYGWVIVAALLGAFWFVPYLDPLSKGRAYFLLNAAVSSGWGVVTILNQLVVGLPMALLLMMWAGHTCTKTLR